jgi:hypothetical protein
MGLSQRLEKLEETSGINEPCALCACNGDTNAVIYRFMTERGIHWPEPARKSEIFHLRCPWCGALHDMFVEGYTRAEIEAEKRINQEEMECCETGRAPRPEIVELCKWILQRRRELGVQMFGDVYEQAMEASGYFEWERSWLENPRFVGQYGNRKPFKQA